MQSRETTSAYTYSAMAVSDVEPIIIDGSGKKRSGRRLEEYCLGTENYEADKKDVSFLTNDIILKLKLQLL